MKMYESLKAFSLFCFGIAMVSGGSYRFIPFGQDITGNAATIFFCSGVIALGFIILTEILRQKWVQALIHMSTPIVIGGAACWFVWSRYWPWATTLWPEWQIQHSGIAVTLLIGSAVGIVCLPTMLAGYLFWGRLEKEVIKSDPEKWDHRGRSSQLVDERTSRPY